VRAKEMLETHGFDVNDRVLRSREEVDAFKAQHGIPTTPLVFIEGEKIGGSDDLETYLRQLRPAGRLQMIVIVAAQA
jgi:glutaredoxin